MFFNYFKATVVSLALLTFGEVNADIYALGYMDGKPVLWKNGVVSKTLSKENGKTYSSIVELDGKIYICCNIGKKSAAWVLHWVSPDSETQINSLLLTR